MKAAFDSPWTTFFAGIAITAMLYALAWRLVPHGIGS